MNAKCKTASWSKRLMSFVMLTCLSLLFVAAMPSTAKANPIDDVANYFSEIFGLNQEPDVADDYYNLLWKGDESLALTAVEDDQNGTTFKLDKYDPDNERQKFKIESTQANNQYYLYLSSGQASNQALDVPDGNYYEGAKLQTWSSNESTNQKFLLQLNKDGSFTVTTQAVPAYAVGVNQADTSSDIALMLRGSQLQGSEDQQVQWMLKEARLPGMEYTEAAIGDKLVYSVTQEVNTLGVNAFVRYEDMDIHDTIPDGLKYISARLLDKSGVDITKSAGTMKYDDSTRQVKFVFSDSYLQKYMALNGETYTLEITTEIEKIPSSQEFKNTGYTTINDTTLTSNEVKTPIKPADTTIDKKANNSQFAARGQITYTIDVSQTKDQAAVRDVVVADKIPDGLTLVEGSLKVTASDGVTTQNSVNGKDITITIDRLKKGQTVHIEYKCTIDDGVLGTYLTNTAQVSGKGVQPHSDDETIYVLAPVKYFVDGSNTPVYTDETGTPDAIYKVKSDATKAGTKANCTRFDGWYLDKECTIKYDPNKNGIKGGGFNLYGRNVVTLSYAPTNSSYFKQHPEKTFYLDEGLKTKYTNLSQILPASEEHYWGENVTFAKGKTLWHLDMGASREIVPSDGVYGSPNPSGTPKKSAVLNGDTVAYIDWAGKTYDGVYREQ